MYREILDLSLFVQTLPSVQKRPRFDISLFRTSRSVNKKFTFPGTAGSNFLGKIFVECFRFIFSFLRRKNNYVFQF